MYQIEVNPPAEKIYEIGRAVGKTNTLWVGSGQSEPTSPGGKVVKKIHLPPF